jgi:hypothetical protein
MRLLLRMAALVAGVYDVGWVWGGGGRGRVDCCVVRRFLGRRLGGWVITSVVVLCLWIGGCEPPVAGPACADAGLAPWRRRLDEDPCGSPMASALAVIDASHNGLVGTIPHSYGALPLTYLDLSFNNLVGSLPATLDCLSNLR